MSSERKFKILSIDGGGIRGIYSAHILKRIEEELKINLNEYFDMIAGTSTGSIIAAGIACNIPLSDIIDLYKDKGKDIFSKKIWWKFPKYFCSKFKSKELKKLLDEKFEEIKLGDIKQRLLLPASNITTGKPYVSKSLYHDEFIRDKHIKIADAVLASCSAPTYFDPCPVGTTLLADGGMWANNPSFVALIDAKKRLNKDIKNVEILSIGTGLYKPEYNFRTSAMGFFNGWRHSKLIEYILSLQSQSTENYLNVLLEDNQKLRINFESNKELTLDDNTKISALIARADEDFTYNFKKIKEFLAK